MRRPRAANPPGRVKEATLSLPELNQRARILRDVDGMPHIYAFDEHDAVFLQGWVTAQDRLFQIDVIRRQASGTLAELLGVGPGNAVLRSDIELRTHRVAPRGRALDDGLLAGRCSTHCRPTPTA